MHVCPFCGLEKESKAGASSHSRLCSENPDRRTTFTKTGLPAWNRGKTKDTDSRLTAMGEIISLKLSGKPRASLTDDRKRRLSESARERGFGGVTQSRWIKYNGKTLGSSYELRVAQSLDENDVKWTTCSRIRYIDPNGKTRTYTPDFYLPEYDVYLDPKNDFLLSNINPRLGFSDREKIALVEKQTGIRVILLDKGSLDWMSIQNML
jgi:hypothetical protein